MPDTFTHGYVVGNLIISRGDGSDAGRLPDVVGATQVKPKFTRVRNQEVVLNPNRLVVHEPIVTAVMSNGDLTGDVDTQGAPKQDAVPGVWLVVGDYTVDMSGHATKKTVTVTAAHTQAAPLDLATAGDIQPPPGTTLQTVELPAGAAPGQILGWTDTGLGWVDAPEGTGGGGTTLTSYDQVSTLADYPTTFPADLTGYVQDDDARLSDARTPTAHQHTAAQISDATTVGRSVLQASSATAARTAIGAGTSSLTIGTGSTTAAAGDHGHTLNETTDTATRVAMTPAERTKLGGVATNATANSTDAQLRDRSTHTGTQAQSTVTNLTTDLAAKAPTARTITAGTGLSGGGDLSANRTLSVSYGTTAGTAAQGNDSRIVNAVQPTDLTDALAGKVDKVTGASLVYKLQESSTPTSAGLPAGALYMTVPDGTPGAL